MKKRSKIILVITILVISLLAWAPWITNDYAINKVLDYYTKNPPPTNEYGQAVSGKIMDIDEVPGITRGDLAISGQWYPFGKFVVNPEGGFFVFFWGGML